MKIAHLILIHKNPAQVTRLLDALDTPGVDFFLHIDKKTDITPYLPLADRPNTFIVQPRTPVYWAGYGTIQATIYGFQFILARGGYDYINVISGQDFPLRSGKFIYEYIRERNGKEFITCESIDGEWSAAASRVRKYHLINWRIAGKFRLEKWVNRFFPPRKFPVDHQIVGRANWFTLTTRAVRYSLDFLERHPAVIRYYKLCWGADEFIFSTILYNSEFRDHIVNNLIYVDWRGQTQGHPRILRAHDLQAMVGSGKLFARKMDMDLDPDLFRNLEEWIAANSNIF